MKRISHLVRYAVLALVAMLAVSCGGTTSNVQIDGVQGPNFNVVDGKALISVTFTSLELVGGGRFPIPKMPNSFMELSPAQTGGTLLQVSLDPADIDSTDWSLVDPHTLPGGRALPGIAGGQLPALAVEVPALNDTTVYVSKQIFGFFIPVKLGAPGAIVTFRVYNGSSLIGNVSAVGEDTNGQNSGLLLLMNLSSSQKAKLKSLIEFSKMKQNKGKVF